MDQHRQSIFKLASILLHYPDDEVVYSKDLQDFIHDIPNRGIRSCFQKFLNEIKKMSYDELCTHYVTTFDFNEKATLYLTYRIFGDKKERGPALIKLKFEFAKAEVLLDTDELPDYFPLILEFASIAPIEAVQRVFAIHRKTIDELQEELEKIKSPYRWLLAGCSKAIQSVMENTKAS